MSDKSARKGPPLGDERILFRTSRGDVVVALYDSVAPKHAAQIRKLVKLGVYDSVPIYRVEPGFVAQVTNAQNRLRPLTSEQRAAISDIPSEFSALPHKLGALSMARDDDAPNSAETSFSFMLGRARELDGKYTVFGEVTFGMTVLQQVAREPRAPNNRPYHPFTIDSALVKSEAEIAELSKSNQLRPLVPLPKRVPPPRPRSP